MELTGKHIDVGHKLRHFRRLKGLTLIELAGRIGCSESLLSKIENDKVRPSVRILHRLVGALEANIAMLLHQDSAESDLALRPHERIRITANGDGITIESLIPNPGTGLLQATLHLIQPGAASGGRIEHMGEEVGYILEGQLELKVGDRVLHLNAGDSFHFRSEVPHEYRNPGEIPTRLVWVNTPPTF